MNSSDSSKPAIYSQEDIQKILQLALAKQTETDIEFSEQQLQEIATELNIDRSSLQLAKMEWSTGQTLAKKRQEFDQYRWGNFKRNCGRYAIIAAGFVGLNIVTSGGVLSWAIYPLFFSGLGVSLAGWNLINQTTDEYEKSFQQWYAKQKIKSSVISLINRFLPS